MISQEDFKENEKSETCTKTFGCGLRIYITHPKDDEGNFIDKYVISAYAPGWPQQEYLTTVNCLDECNKKYKEISDDLEFSFKLNDKFDLHKFVLILKDEYDTMNRTIRYHKTSEDGVLKFFVKKDTNNGGYVPKVNDFIKGTNKRTDFYLGSACVLEHEAEEICERCLNEYNLNGHYLRVLQRKAKHIAAHEDHGQQVLQINEFYLFGKGKQIELTRNQYESILALLGDES